MISTEEWKERRPPTLRKTGGAEIPGRARTAAARPRTPTADPLLRASLPAALFLAILLLAASVGAAFGQSIPAGIEVGAGLARPLGDFQDAGGRPGLLATVDAVVALHPRLGAYAGYRWADYDCPDAPCPALTTPASLTEAGWAVGLDAGFPARGSLTPRVRAGVLLHRLGYSGNDAPVELGMEIGAGVDIALSPRVAVTPRVRYMRWDSDVPEGFGTAGTRLNVSNVSIAVGLRFSPFG